MTSAWNNAQKLTSVTSSLSDSNHPADLFANGAYNAPGMLTGATLGNTVSESYQYGKRLWMTSMTSGSVYSLTLGHAADGVVTSATDVNGSWTYAYDNFNRASAANGGTNDDYTYAYDRYGNRWQQNGTHSMSLSFSGNNNRADGYTYDAAVNLQVDNQGCNYTYDAEDRITGVTGGTCAGETYGYDALGRWISKANSWVTYYYLYDRQGRPFEEASSATVWTRMELYAGTRHLGTYTGSIGPAYFDYADWIGTERVVTTSSGPVYETCTSLPFGDALTCTGGDVSPIHFTGKERDIESNLDNFGARYNSLGMGRFMSPDPLTGNAEDPQTLNRYVYVRNGPLNLTDPTGLFIVDCTWTGCSGPTVNVNGLQQTTFNTTGFGVNDMVACPNSACSGFTKRGEYFQFVAGAGGASGYVRFSDITQGINEANGTFYSDKQYQAYWAQGYPTHIGGQYDRLTNNMAQQGMPGTVNPDDSKISGGHADFAFTCPDLTKCGVGRYDDGIHVTRDPNGQLWIHDDTVSPWISPSSFSFSTLFTVKFWEHGFVDLFGGTLCNCMFSQ
jgi:RHS repeat-associated protein